MKLVKIFGADAARQRAEQYAQKHGGQVVTLDEVERNARVAFGLDVWDRIDGITYTHGVTQD